MSGLGTHPFEKGLVELANGGYAWLQPDGGWGWSNAGLIVDGDQSLLVDTLFDLPLTAEMLAAMRAAEPDMSISTLVNTHANGDHCNGNELVSGAEIIASQACADELAAEPKGMMATMMSRTPQMGETGEFLEYCFSAFEFDGINPTPPTRTFEGRLDVQVGDKRVELRQVGPAHTRGDILVHVPNDRTVFSGDILFIEGHPIIWVGPIRNWIDACNYMLSLDVETVVPGHGPITDKRGIEAVRDYLSYVRDEARARFDADMPIYEAALDISLADYDSWGDAERIVINVATLYKEFAGNSEPNDVMELFGLMARIHKERRG
jgi:glyoxylase-like metal-dependent hydrolase (beta-lactamase superfamily II)